MSADLSSSPTDTPETQRAASPRPRSGDDVRIVRRHALLLLGTAAAIGAACAYLWRDYSAARDDVRARRARTSRTADNARQIAALRVQAPMADRAAPRGLDLLEHVSIAMRDVGLPARSLVATVPQAARTLPGDDAAERSLRLLFEEVPLEALLRFAGELVSGAPQLRITTLLLRPKPAGSDWSAELVVSHVVSEGAKP